MNTYIYSSQYIDPDNVTSSGAMCERSPQKWWGVQGVCVYRYVVGGVVHTVLLCVNGGEYGVWCVCLVGGERWIGRENISRIHSIRDNCLHTNRQNKGWTSADRSTKATLMLTVPRSLFKSSTKDLTWPTLENIIAVWCWHKCYCYTQTLVKVSIVAYQHGFWLRGVQS